ncbi:MAG TPA: amidohydrolase family protein, partial [Dehalococcoidia bacterium]|nr:amidohydrolase family protein [Dehalococcoidia bacterium]
RNKIPERFPGLRFGFIEAGASWVPFLLHRLKRTLGVDSYAWGPSLFRDYRLYVACEADEDLPYLVQSVGEDNLLIGSDYGHADPAVEAALVATMRARSDVPAAAIDKILGLNAKSFYAL